MPPSAWFFASSAAQSSLKGGLSDLSFESSVVKSLINQRGCVIVKSLSECRSVVRSPSLGMGFVQVFSGRKLTSAAEMSHHSNVSAAVVALEFMSGQSSTTTV
jgi:hypothetical protein